MSGQKVFGIGFHKTGTTSLGAALDALGYRTCDGAGAVRQAIGHADMMHLLREQQLEPIMSVAERYDACTDNPWFLLFRDLDRRFPGSKFILTVRDERRWIESAVRYYGQSESELRTWIYGAARPSGNEPGWLGRYREHIDQVKTYFRDRPNDLLVVDWEQGGGWGELGAFLGRITPSRPFPRITKARRPAKDLTDGIVVLTQARSGSSLVMQTLRLLGATSLGRFTLHAMATRRSDEEWTALARSTAPLLLPIRTPAECLVSSEALPRAELTTAGRAKFFRASVRNYLLDLGYLVSRVCSPDFSRAAPICVDYRQAVTDPSGYVMAVAVAGGLRPTSSQVAQAVANIDRGLYRTRIDDVAAVRRIASGVRPLDTIHALLRSEDRWKWARLRDALPPWVFTSEPAVWSQDVGMPTARGPAASVRGSEA